MSGILAQLREAAAQVARRARYVRIAEEQIASYAASLPPGVGARSVDEAPPGDRAQTAAFWLTLDAINFGSGWFPTLNKRPGHSGYHTIAAGLRERFASRGPWTAPELQALSAADIAAILAQEPSHELMTLFARSLNDLGRHAAEAGGFAQVVKDAHGSATQLVDRLATWDCFTDTATYDGLTLPFLKRAQIAAADLVRAGVTEFSDLGRLTMFADNLVPHVLRLDGILTYDRGLLDRIEREELIEPGSAEEVEIRACALHAVELIVAERPSATAAGTDQLLWLRGQGALYKASPRHRCRTTAY